MLERSGLESERPANRARADPSPGLRAAWPPGHQKETPWITEVIHGVFIPFGGNVITAPGLRFSGMAARVVKVPFPLPMRMEEFEPCGWCKPGVDVAVLVEISRQSGAGFLLYRHRHPFREIAGAIPEINEQTRAEIVLQDAIGGQWIGEIYVAILVEITERNFSPDGARSKIDRLLQGKLASAVAEVAGNEETSGILRARSRQDEVKITVLVQVGHLDVIALRVDHHILPDSEAAEAIAEEGEDLQVGPARLLSK